MTMAVRVWLAVLAATAMTSTAAWDISSSGVTRPATPRGLNQELEKTWFISQSESDSDSDSESTSGPTSSSRSSVLRYLQLHLPGRVFVEVDPTPLAVPKLGRRNASGSVDAGSDSDSESDSKSEWDEDDGSEPIQVQEVAKIVLSGDSEAVLDQIQVVNAKHKPSTTQDGEDPDGPDEKQAVKVHYKNARFDGAGFVLVRVVLRTPQALRALDLAASADVVVDPDVLVRNDPTQHVELRTTGSGDLFLPDPAQTQTYAVGSLAIQVAGTATVQLQAKSLAVQRDVMMKVSGSGAVTLVADAVSVGGKLSTTIAGSGSVVVQGTTVQVQNMTTDVAGSGDVSFSRGGTCVNEEVVVAGSGTVSTGSLVCTNANVDVIGSGSVLVQVTHRLHTTSVLSGVVRYFGVKPEEIVTQGEFLMGGDAKGTVRPAAVNSFREAELLPVPPREPVHLDLHFRRSWFSGEPRSHSWYYGISNQRVGDDMAFTTWLAQEDKQNTQLQGVVVAVASVGIVCAVATVALKMYRAHARRQYTLLT